LLVLIAAIVTAGVAVAVPVKVRPLGIVVLSPLGIARAGVQTVLVTLVYGNLGCIAVATVPTIAIIAISAVVPVPIVIAITPVVPIAVATILIISILIPVPRSLCLGHPARSHSDDYKKGQCQHDSPEFVPEIV